MATKFTTELQDAARELGSDRYIELNNVTASSSDDLSDECVALVFSSYWPTPSDSQTPATIEWLLQPGRCRSPRESKHFSHGPM